MILCGDVGGTRVRLGLAEEENGCLTLRDFKEYSSREAPEFYSLLDDFLATQDMQITHACIGAAGPVKNGRCDVTHLPWMLEESVLSDHVGVSVRLINDLAAMAASVPYLSETDSVCLQEGDPDNSGRIAVLAAGTGLGQAVLIPQGGRFQIMDTEGGQCDFAPRDDLEIEFANYLRHRFGRVSIEQVLSGPGLESAFQFFVTRGNACLPDDLKQEVENEPPVKAIIDWGLNQRFDPCAQAVQLFVKVYGAVAGNLALQVLAQGGVWLGGGLAPKLIARLKEEEFINAFRDKGQFADWMQNIPVRVILNEQASLVGAAGFALGSRFETSSC